MVNEMERVLVENTEDQYYNIKKNFTLSPAGIINSLNLRRPIYKQTAAYGHMGRTDIDLPWEHLDKVETLRQQANL